jgi:assimilatory nitrate reductase catalytic subunit
MRSTPRFVQGVYHFEGKGLDAPLPLEGCPTYTVPPGVVTQPVYFRAGNASHGLVCIVLMRDGLPLRYFPVGIGADSHVSLRVVQDLEVGTQLALHVSAPEGVDGEVVVDLGLVEV